MGVKATIYLLLGQPGDFTNGLGEKKGNGEKEVL